MPAPQSSATAELGARVRSRRQELGLSQERLADIAGLHWTFVGQVERGRRNLSLHNLLKLAAALDADPGQLVAGLKPPAPADASSEASAQPNPKRAPTRRTAKRAPTQPNVKS
jgi:transcriptional regulator with XRE-family HTH domain